MDSRSGLVGNRHSRQQTGSAPPRVRDHSIKWSCNSIYARRWLIGAVAGLALALPNRATVIAGQFVFGLDNRPRVPISIDPPANGNGAEDPYGQVAAPTFVGPSPSLLTFSPPLGRTLSDADILTPSGANPQVNTMRPFNTNYIDEISSNRAAAHGRLLRLAFSVDRASVGLPASAVHNQFLLNQQSADIFLTNRNFAAPGQFVGTLVGVGWLGFLPSVGSGNSNVLLLNQSQLKLTAGGGLGNYVGSNVLAPPVAPGTHDNVDAFDIGLADTTGDLVSDKLLYFSVNPDQKNLNPAYISAAAIYRIGPGSIFPNIFAGAALMGLDSFGQNTDNIDGLEVYDRGVIGVLEPGVDYALFSLSPGSKSLSVAPRRTAADLFFTDFNHSFATYATDADLGLSGTINPAEFGGPGSGSELEPTGNDNLDAVAGYPTGDMDWDGKVDLADIDDFLQGLTRPLDYINTVGHWGPADDIGDFVPAPGLDFDDVVPFRTALQGGGIATSDQIVPEPNAFSLTVIVVIALIGRQRCLWPRRQTPHKNVGISIRGAYTLVELLVVVTIISVLLALLMPAIQAARESARSEQCCDHLKQLLLANQNYHSVHNRFPAGSTLSSREFLSGQSWLVYCLPYLEEPEVADRILKRGENIAPPIQILFCPSDDIVRGANLLNITSYCGSGGAGKDPNYVIPLEAKYCGDVYTDGIFFPLSKTSAAKITDGLSYTLAIGERTYIKNIWTKGAYWVGSADKRLCTESSKNVRWPINSPATTYGYYVLDPDAPASGRTMPLNDLYFGSKHPGGAWFAFAGGNVDFIADDIAFSVYQDLASRNGGERSQ